MASVAIYLSLGNNGIYTKAKQAKEETNKQTATEKINLKITSVQIETYGKRQEMPTLQELADSLCKDKEIEYVELESKSKLASLNKIIVGDKTSIYTKLKEYPYEFEINSNLQLASVDNKKIIVDNGEMKFINNNHGFTDTEGKATCISYGLSYESFGTTASDGWLNMKTEKNVDINLNSKFEISTQVYFNNETTRNMGGVHINFYKEDNTIISIILYDAWEGENAITRALNIGNKTIYSANMEQ